LCEHTSDEAQTCSDTVLNLAAADIHTNIHTDQTGLPVLIIILYYDVTVI